MPTNTNHSVSESNFYNQNQGDVTYATWFIRPTANGPQPLIAIGGRLALSFDNNQIVVKGADGKIFTSYTLPADDGRHHLVLTTVASKATMYLDARKVVEFDLPAFNANAAEPTTIGSNALQGSVLRLTIFNRHFSMDEVARLYRRGTGKTVLDLKTTGLVLDYPADQIAKLYGQNEAKNLFENQPEPISPPEPDLPSVYPFQIKLTNKDNPAPAIYIVSDVARTTAVQTIDLTITNETPHRYEVASFTLSFRKGTLHEDLTKDKAQKFCEKLANAIGEGATVTATEEPATIQFEVKKPGGGNFSFAPKAPRTITLSGIYASPGTGTRTSGFEVKFEGVQKMLETTPSGAAFSFGRNAVLQVINHQGFAHAPIHFGVLGNNFLLNNDTTAQGIAIFMQSLDGKPVAMSAQTRFVFSFYANAENAPVQGEAQTDAEAPRAAYIGFGDRSKVTAIDLGVLPVGFQQGKADRKEVDEFGKRDITIVPTQDLATAFAIFKFEKILLSGDPGLVKVHVTVENLPGYWDSHFDVTFIKGPMAMAGSQVGIGTQPVEGNALSVKGDTHLGGKVDVTGDTHLEGNVEIGKNSLPQNLNVHGDVNINNGDFAVGTPNNQFTVNKDGVRIITDKNSHLYVKGNVDITGFLTVHSNPVSLCRAWGYFEVNLNDKSPHISRGNITIESFRSDTENKIVFYMQLPPGKWDAQNDLDYFILGYANDGFSMKSIQAEIINSAGVMTVKFEPPLSNKISITIAIFS